MNLVPELCYRALLAHDRRFDGLFFVAVKTTRTYCRPVCTVKPPQFKNCTFYETAAACERDGYRPCLRCRPELAPGNSTVDAKSRLVARAVLRIEEGALSSDSLESLSEELGVTSRHLRRVFESELGVTPVQFVQTQRLLVAKRLLTDTTMPITQVALASGFASVRRFNALFIERYHINPRTLRKSSLALASVSNDTFNCQLTFRPPYDWYGILSFLRARACAGVEFVDDAKYMRTVAIDGVTGWLSVSLGGLPATLSVTMSSSLSPKFLQVVARLQRLFDLHAQPDTIAKHLGALAQHNPGLRVPGAFDSFEVMVRAVLGQQVSVKAATNLAGRLAERYGKKIATQFEELFLITPEANALAQARVEDVQALGIMPARAATILAVAKAFRSGGIQLQPGDDYEETVAKLVALPGIGEWTAEYIAMRCLNWPDAFPHSDLGIKKYLGATSKKELLARSEKYRPWRAYAAMHMWQSLSQPTAVRSANKGAPASRRHRVAAQAARA